MIRLEKFKLSDSFYYNEKNEIENILNELDKTYNIISCQINHNDCPKTIIVIYKEKEKIINE